MVEQERLKKLEQLREQGIEPYAYSFGQTHHSEEIKSNYSKLENKRVSIAGRMMTRRGHGKLTFISLQDSEGQIQLWLSEDDLGAHQYSLLKYLDIGDIIGVRGAVTKTNKGEISVKATTLNILSKALRGLPDKWHGLKDTELRYRQRYVDLVVNPEVRKVFETRTKVINAIREFLNKRGYIEVETPILQQSYGGAAAKPFKTFLNNLKMDVYLRISNELYLKRLIVGGMEKVYEFSKDFRNEAIDSTHNPEFTQLETYEAYIDYNGVMQLFQDIVKYAAKKVLGTTKIQYQGNIIDLSKWKKQTMADAIKEHLNIDVNKMSDEGLINFAGEKHIKTEEGMARGEVINEIFESIDKQITQPTIIIDHPKETTPLCKTHRQNSELVERFEPFVAGMEIGNAYSELTDPIRQRELLEEQAKARKEESWAGDVDEDFIRALEYGMPPTGGLGIGIDRLVMLFTNQPSIKEIILFPFMGPEESER